MGETAAPLLREYAWTYLEGSEPWRSYVSPKRETYWSWS